MHSFCVQENGIFCIDTTFETFDGLYLLQIPNFQIYLCMTSMISILNFLGHCFGNLKKLEKHTVVFLRIINLWTSSNKSTAVGFDKGLAEGMNFWFTLFFLGWELNYSNRITCIEEKNNNKNQKPLHRWAVCFSTSGKQFGGWGWLHSKTLESEHYWRNHNII